MALTRDFKEAGPACVQADLKFPKAPLKEGIDTMLAGDVDAGKASLRDHIKATVGFEQPGPETGSSPKSLIRMFGPTGHQTPAAACRTYPARDCAAALVTSALL